MLLGLLDHRYQGAFGLIRRTWALAATLRGDTRGLLRLRVHSGPGTLYAIARG